HLKIIGSIVDAMAKANKQKFIKKIEIEVTDRAQAIKAVNLGADIIMLDNMTPEVVKDLSAELKKLRPEVTLEISGGITPENIGAYAPYADVISLGWLTHSTPAKDFSLEVVP
ncbi:MAG: nicotinate-nucleotide diphosphorylase (carboxylating), partial [Thermoplasmata archaeon]|nr:nicotinate-nucleotide diphosphorylase (carboxylating) [Thermoplasmata archaeon]